MSAAGIVALCNAALRELGQSPIISLEDGTRAADLCRAGFPLARDTVLRGYAWNSAMRRATLPALTEPPAFGWRHRYALPEGPDEPEPYCERLWEIDGAPCSDRLFAREGRQILTDIGPPLRIRYVARVEDPGLYDALLQRVIALRLAADIAFALTGNRGHVGDLEQRFQAALLQARRADAQEGPSAELLGSGWLDARI